MTVGKLILRGDCPLATPLTAQGIAGWLFACRFLLQPQAAEKELDCLERGEGHLALAGPWLDKTIPLPALPHFAGLKSKDLPNSPVIPLPPNCVLGSVDLDQVKSSWQDAMPVVPMKRPRLVLNRHTGTVLQEDGLFFVYGHLLERGESTWWIRTNLWNARQLQDLAQAASLTGYGARRSQGFGGLSVAFVEEMLTLPQSCGNPTHLLWLADGWPGSRRPDQNTWYAIRLHRSAGDTPQAFYRYPSLLFRAGSLTPIDQAMLEEGFATVGEPLRVQSPETKNIRPLLSAQVLGLPVRVEGLEDWA